MIRRDATSDDGSPAWVLVTQMEHARVAGELAEHWGLPPIPPVHPRDVVLPTIYRHDDGWADWERQPTIDPSTGRPRSFTEMSDEAAHEIWRRSIASVADLGPLAQYMVAQHFMRLRRGGEEADQPEVIAFLEEFDGCCEQWLTAWQAEDLAVNTAAAAENAVDQLQMFDALSLALCCADGVGQKVISTPSGHKISLSPAGTRIGLRPWPCTVSMLHVSARGCIISAQPLGGDGELRERMAAAAPIELQWRLGP